MILFLEKMKKQEKYVEKNCGIDYNVLYGYWSHAKILREIFVIIWQNDVIGEEQDLWSIKF